MLENVGRKVVLIVLLLLVSAGLLLIPDEPFRLGLDLQGGTRIVYRFDFAEARARGELGPNENTDEILAQAVAILRNRVDPYGTRDVPVRTEGSDRIVIELPGNTAVAGTSQVATTLGQAINETDVTSLALADGSGFSESGVIEIGGEQIRYGKRSGSTLLELERSKNGKIEAHAAGATVRLVNSDAIRSAIENLGELAFVLVAEDRDFAGKDTDLQAQNTRLTEWMTAHPGEPVTAFNKVSPEDGGPDPSIRWYPTRFDQGPGAPAATLVPKSPAETFHGDALQRVFGTADNFG